MKLLLLLYFVLWMAAVHVHADGHCHAAATTEDSSCTGTPAAAELGQEQELDEILDAHEYMVAFLTKHSQWDMWGMPQFWTLEEELEVVTAMKGQDCRDRIEETGDDSWNKLYLLGNVRFGNRPSLIAEYEQQLDNLLSDPNSLETQALLRLRIGREALTDGHLEKALKHFHALCFEDVVEAATCMSDDATSRYSWILRDLIGLTYFRMAETSNCQAKHNFDSCLFPVKDNGVHSLRRGALGATKVYAQSLKINPEDLGSKFLYNLAQMTLDNWPDNLEDPNLLIDPAVFASDYDIGRFYDISSALGVGLRGLAGGAVMVDFDQDGYLDLMSSGSSARDQLSYFHNNGDGTWSDFTEEANLAGLVNGIDMSVCDYNNDGLPDPFVIRGGWHFDWWGLPNSLLRNNGDGTFTDVTKDAGLWSEYACHSANWMDFNNDGFQDVFFANEIDFDGPPPFTKQPSQLFMNNGDGTFTDIAETVGLAESPWTKSASWGDFNNDGWIDLFVSNYDGPVEGGSASKLWRNDGPKLGEDGKPLTHDWTFTDVSEAAGIDQPKFGFTSWFFDYDQDGWEDLLIVGFSTVDIWKVASVYINPEENPNMGDRTVLYRNNQDGTFTDVSGTVGHRMEDALNTMGANFGDLDNDGFPDVFLGTGAPDMRTLQPNRVFRNNGGKNFQDVTTSGNFGHLQKGHGIAFGDFDHDGDQDIFVNLGAMYTADHFTDALYLNPGHGNNFITIDVRGVNTNKMAFGARIEVVVNSETSVYHTVGPGGTFGSNSIISEMGLGQHDNIEKIVISWPVGNVKQVFEDDNLKRFINQRVRITEGTEEIELLDTRPIDFSQVVQEMIREQSGEMFESDCGCH